MYARPSDVVKTKDVGRRSTGRGRRYGSATAADPRRYGGWPGAAEPRPFSSGPSGRGLRCVIVTIADQRQSIRTWSGPVRRAEVLTVFSIATDQPSPIAQVGRLAGHRAIETRR